MSGDRIKLGFRASLNLPAFEAFKEHYPDQIASHQDRLYNLNSRHWFLLTSIQYAINNCCRYRKDPGRDSWNIMENLAGIGDCEDFVFTKRALAAEAGFALSTLSPVICSTSDNKDHMILVHHADEDYMFDNIVGTIMPIANVPYKLRYILIADNWVMIL